MAACSYAPGCRSYVEAEPLTHVRAETRFSVSCSFSSTSHAESLTSGAISTARHGHVWVRIQSCEGSPRPRVKLHSCFGQSRRFGHVVRSSTAPTLARCPRWVSMLTRGHNQNCCCWAATSFLFLLLVCAGEARRCVGLNSRILQQCSAVQRNAEPRPELDEVPKLTP